MIAERSLPLILKKFVREVAALQIEKETAIAVANGSTESWLSLDTGHEEASA